MKPCMMTESLDLTPEPVEITGRVCDDYMPMKSSLKN